MNSAPKQRERTIGFDILRGVGTLVVVIAHVLLFVPQELPLQIPGLTWRVVYVGNFLLECFFAMSGYLIGGPLLHYREFNRISLYNYGVDRATRILPCYYVVFAATSVAGFVFLGDRTFHYAYLLFIQCYADSLYFIGVAWTLSVEVASYILLPAFIWLFRFRIRVFEKTSVNIIFFCLVVIALETAARGLTAWLHPGLHMDDELRKQVHLRMDALLYGLMIACLKDACGALYRKLESGAFLVAALIALVALVEWQQGDYFIRNLPGEGRKTLHALIDFTASGFLAAAVLPFCARISWEMFPREPVRRAFEFFVYTARISYSLYLVHFPLIQIFVWFYKRTAPENPLVGSVYLLLLMPCCVYACFRIADWLYARVEAPGMRLRKRFKIAS